MLAVCGFDWLVLGVFGWLFTFGDLFWVLCFAVVLLLVALLFVLFVW